MDSSSSYSSAEIKTGFFVFITIVILLILTFIVGGWLKGGAAEWKIRFGYINGLADSAPVYYAGREVGKVGSIEIIKGDPRPVLVTVKISPDAVVRQDSVAYIDTLGMMGEKFIEISLGSLNSPVKSQGAIIEGVDPIPMHLLIRKMNLLADEVNVMVKNLDPILEMTNNLLKGHEEEISKSISNLHQVTANLRDMTENLKRHPWRLLRKG